MPIGFWAMSREGVKELYRHCGNGQAPSNEALNKLVRILRDKLDEVTLDIIFQATKEERKRRP